MRKSYADRWFGGPNATHQGEINNMDTAIKKLSDWIKEHCDNNPCDPK
jgi:hypothetical protein